MRMIVIGEHLEFGGGHVQLLCQSVYFIKLHFNGANNTSRPIGVRTEIYFAMKRVFSKVTK